MPHNGLDGKPGGTRKSTPTPAASCRNIFPEHITWETLERGNLSNRGLAAQIQLTSSAAGSPASLSPSPENNLPRMTRVGSGRTSHESFAYYDHATSLLRTCQVSLFGGDTMYSETLPRSGLLLNGKLYRRQPLVRRTDGTGSGSLPTPDAHCYKQGERGTGTGGGPQLSDVIAKMWPSPKSSPSGPDYARRNRKGAGGDDLATQVGGQLNPQFCEWLMGYPKDYTVVGSESGKACPESPKESLNESTGSSVSETP